ncbi:ATP-binding protein [Dactylosporangium aurantiacum]|uniref:ATP-binding protein n=1 Tax=Dactylosporangium aurantiacum TaxID=35754 RepID=A0A9Q9ICG1_9ACTN|nr:ATP-binding protein [Dactylosporangium aurantiacum]MDG6103670.1 ATP-binding protein [Dactylosporangium aurantiacum]UWZ51845.1 ATP-binding protein [Dactylosporangium aurantiacum]
MHELTTHVDLPLADTAPAVARAVLAATLPAWGFTDQPWLDTACLVVTELVSNAVRHGGGRLVLRLHAQAAHVTVSVADGSPVVPRPRPDPDGDGGRGLYIIEALSQRWGVEDRQGGKRVWVLLQPHPAPP